MRELHVVAFSSRKYGGWVIVCLGPKKEWKKKPRLNLIYNTKDLAVQCARPLAKEHKAKLVIHICKGNRKAK